MNKEGIFFVFYIHFSNWILTYVRRLRGTTNNAVSMAMV